MPSSFEKMVAFHVSRLRDKNPEVQLGAIRELVDLGAEAESALEALKQLHDTTTDPTVKSAAQKAGYVIFMAVKERNGG